MEKPTRICSIDGCENILYARGWCNKHYLRWRTHGDPTKGRDRFATPDEALEARVVQRGTCTIWVGSMNQSGYGRINVSGRVESVHRYVWEKHNGPIPKDREVDHVCHNRACVEVSHLRLATRSENCANFSRLEKRNKSGYRNVHKEGNRWLVSFKRRGKVIRYGLFDDLEEAAKIAAKGRSEIFGEFAGLG